VVTRREWAACAGTGLRGGGKAVRAERERDTGWAAIELSTPGSAVPVAAPPKGLAATPD